jgi:hypothetical protein
LPPHVFNCRVNADDNQQNNRLVNPPRHVFSGEDQINIVGIKEKHRRQSGRNDGFARSVVSDQPSDRKRKKRNRSNVNRPERNKLQKLERQLNIISNGFVSMQTDRQQKAIDRIKEIKHEIDALNNAIERIDKPQSKISSYSVIDNSLSEEDERSSVISFGFRFPSASRWFYASRMHNGKHRTIQFGLTTDEPTHDSYIR